MKVIYVSRHSGRGFLSLSAAGAVLAAWQPLGAAESVFLKSWGLTEFASLPKKLSPVMKVTASNELFGVSKLVGGCRDLRAAEATVAGVNLLDHNGVHDAMTVANVPPAQRAVLDIACWGLHRSRRRQPQQRRCPWPQKPT